LCMEYHNTHILSLSYELLFHILSQLNAEEISIIGLVCKGFYTITQTEFLWYRLCVKDGVHTQPLISKHYKEFYYGDDETFKASILQPPTKEETQKHGYWWRKHYLTYHCIHFDNVDLDVLDKLWSAAKSKMPDQRCHAPSCFAIDVWLCLHNDCGFAGCGREKGAHALQHFQKSRHSLTMNMRERTLWCYKCDRFIEGHTTAVSQKKLRLDCMLFCEGLYLHRLYFNDYTTGVGESRTCKFCDKKGIHYKCIFEHQQLQKASLPSKKTDQ